MGKQNKEAGAAHIALFVVIIVVAAAAFAGWWVWHSKHGKKANDSVSQAVENAKCDYNDKDLCKFFSGWKAENSYTVTATTKEADGTTTTSVIETNGKSDSHMKVTGATSYETIMIGDDLYTKAGNTWYKETLPKDGTTKYTDDTSAKLPDPNTEENKAAAAITYKKIGKEACGTYTCFKYQVVDPSDTTTTSFIWFDDKDYQLRRMQTTTDGSTYDASFNYDNVTISVPSPTKDLQPGQYIVPGMNEPVDGL